MADVRELSILRDLVGGFFRLVNMSPLVFSFKRMVVEEREVVRVRA